MNIFETNNIYYDTETTNLTFLQVADDLRKLGIKNNKFKKDFIYEINNEEINYLNELRKKIINPIINLEKKINKKQKIKI